MTLEQLVRTSEASRTRIAESHAHMRHALDFPARIKGSLMEKPGKWLGASLAAGFVGSFLFRKKKSPPKARELKRRRGFLLGTLSLAFTLGKPLAKAYAAKAAKDYLAARLASGIPQRHALGRRPPY
ncbi:hypothetical protein HZ994_14410 [Akkermansiaceae bacterium]|nr:hypothetical protein HZ994_14410 [Akkermansiaceae bacterium]